MNLKPEVWYQQRAAVPGIILLRLLLKLWTDLESIENLFFSALLERQFCISQFSNMREKAKAMLAGMVTLLFMVSGEVQLCTN